MALIIYKASAGSGKTYSLVREFLLLTLPNPDSYRHILAITFTNKATAEMKSRIIETLDQLEKGQNSQLLDELLKGTHLENEQLVRHRASVLKKLILYHYSELHVSTIDHFFQTLIKRFARELGIFLGYDIELNTQWVLHHVIESFLLQPARNEDSFSFLLEFVNDNLKQGKKARLEDALKNLGYELFKENVLEFSDVFTRMSDSKWFASVRRKLEDIIDNFITELVKIGNEGLDLMSRHGYDENHFKSKNRGPASFFKKAAGLSTHKGAAASFITKTYREALTGVDKWLVKQELNDQSKANFVKDQLIPLLSKGVQFFDRHFPDYISAQAIKNHLFILAVLSDIDQGLREYRQREGKLLISDLNPMLKELIAGTDTPFILEKSGAWFDHVFIDEFQDTSEFQWHNLRPLVENSLMEGETSLLVGDVKQSIYRWRNSNWRILHHEVEKELERYTLDLRTLNKNWRSGKQIILFNNLLFEKLPSLAQDIITGFWEDREAHKDKLSLITEVYNDAIQETVSNSPDARVELCLREINAELKKDAQQEVSLKWMTEKIRLLINQVDYKQICVLVRETKEVQRVVNWLSRQNDIPAVSQASFQLEASPSVRLLLSTIRWLSDTTNHLYLTEIKKLHAEIHGNKVHHPILAETDVNLVDELKQRAATSSTLYELVRELILYFKLDTIAGEEIFLLAFQDFVHDFVMKINGGVSDFIDWWEEQDEPITGLSDKMNAVRVMTIHKAKGLEFDYVFIPFCSWNLFPDPRNIIWSKTTENLDPQLKVIPVKTTQSLKDSWFSEDYFEEIILSFVDNINLLYVAMTRPVKGLYIHGFYRKSEKISTGLNISDLLYKVFSVLNHDMIKVQPIINNQNEEGLMVEFGELEHWKENDKEKQANTIKIRNLHLSGAALPRLRITRKASDLFDESPERKLNYGKYLHGILSHIKNENDIDKAVSQWVMRGELDENQAGMLKEKLHKIICHPEVNKWFKGDYEIFTERAILLPGGTSRRPDRIMIKGNQAVILDFKFGMQRIEHQNQLKEYSQIFSQMGYNTQAFLFYPDENLLMEVK